MKNTFRNFVLCLFLFFTVSITNTFGQELEIGKIGLYQLPNGKTANLTYSIDDKEIWKVNFDLNKEEGPSAYLGGIHLIRDTIAVIHYYYQNLYPPDKAIVHYFSKGGKFLNSNELLWENNRVSWLSPTDFYGTSAIDKAGNIYLLGTTKTALKSVLSVFNRKGTKLSEKEISSTAKIFSMGTGIVKLKIDGTIVYSKIDGEDKSILNTKIEINNKIKPVIEGGLSVPKIGEHAGVQIKNISVNNKGNITYIRDYGVKYLYRKQSENKKPNILYSGTGKNQRIESFVFDDGKFLIYYITKERKKIEVGKKKKLKTKTVYNAFASLYDKDGMHIESNRLEIDSRTYPSLRIPFAYKNGFLYSIVGDKILVSDKLYKDIKLEKTSPSANYFPETQSFNEDSFLFRSGLKEHILIKY